jgi:hypothetical protein
MKTRSSPKNTEQHVVITHKTISAKFHCHINLESQTYIPKMIHSTSKIRNSTAETA